MILYFKFWRYIMPLYFMKYTCLDIIDFFLNETEEKKTNIYINITNGLPKNLSIYNIVQLSKVWFRLMVLYASSNNISVISWRSVSLVEEVGGPGENYRPVTSHWQAWSHNVLSNTPRHERGSNSQL